MINAVDIFEQVFEEWFPGKVKRTSEEYDMDPGSLGEHVIDDKIEVYYKKDVIATFLSTKSNLKDSAVWFGITKKNGICTETATEQLNFDDPEKFDEILEDMRFRTAEAIKNHRRNYVKDAIVSTFWGLMLVVVMTWVVLAFGGLFGILGR